MAFGISHVTGVQPDSRHAFFWGGRLFEGQAYVSTPTAVAADISE